MLLMITVAFVIQVCTSMGAPWNVMDQLEKWLRVLQVLKLFKMKSLRNFNLCFEFSRLF